MYELYVVRPTLSKSSAARTLLREAAASLESQADDFEIRPAAREFEMCDVARFLSSWKVS